MYFGEKIKLRAYKESDIEDSYVLFNNYDIMSMLMRDSIFPNSLDRQREFVEFAMNSKGPVFHFAVELVETGDYIGGCGVNDFNSTSQTATIGIWLAEEYQGKGLGADTLRTLCRFIFDEMNAQKIKLTFFDYNEKGRKVYEKIGFKKEGTLRKEVYTKGKLHDIHIMGMFRDEFKK